MLYWESNLHQWCFISGKKRKRGRDPNLQSKKGFFYAILCRFFRIDPRGRPLVVIITSTQYTFVHPSLFLKFNWMKPNFQWKHCFFWLWNCGSGQVDHSWPLSCLYFIPPFSKLILSSSSSLSFTALCVPQCDA